MQLFNAVRTHQKNVDEKVKKGARSERQRAKLLSSVSKKDFINVLRSMEGAKGNHNSARKAAKSKQVGLHARCLLSVLAYTLLMCLLCRTAVSKCLAVFFDYLAFLLLQFTIVQTICFTCAFVKIHISNYILLIIFILNFVHCGTNC